MWGKLYFQYKSLSVKVSVRSNKGGFGGQISWIRQIEKLKEQLIDLPSFESTDDKQCINDYFSKVSFAIQKYPPWKLNQNIFLDLFIQACHDRFACAGIVGKHKAQRLAGEHGLVHSGDLVGQGFDV
jgi:hypothetical protein